MVEVAGDKVEVVGEEEGASTACFTSSSVGS